MIPLRLTATPLRLRPLSCSNLESRLPLLTRCDLLVIRVWITVTDSPRDSRNHPDPRRSVVHDAPLGPSKSYPDAPWDCHLPRRSKQPLVSQNAKYLRPLTPPYEGPTPPYEGPGSRLGMPPLTILAPAYMPVPSVASGIGFGEKVRTPDPWMTGYGPPVRVRTGRARRLVVTGRPERRDTTGGDQRWKRWVPDERFAILGGACGLLAKERNAFIRSLDHKFTIYDTETGKPRLHGLQATCVKRNFLNTSGVSKYFYMEIVPAPDSTGLLW